MMGREVQSQQDCLNPRFNPNKQQRCLKTGLLQPYYSGQGQGDGCSSLADPALGP